MNDFTITFENAMTTSLMLATGIVPPLPLDAGGRVSLTVDPARHAELTVRIGDEERAALAADAPLPPPDDRVDARSPLVEVCVHEQGSYHVVVYYRAPAGAGETQ